ncbi:RagB/SusD family nutrient uptake outer membrane protein [Flavihumibacter sp. RY-1]|uniref:RagB/SusD family nutrient uptake outer membrane protein n=1 Tax=Flavihumibacter fluminis TaxID=2909236 RepID=A0ABS9BM65_9BACT|nr:RagB/SusD family nutrient uptake outer membrane protein [Flavihumibacter fluminis]MCF1715929.1 RagB/SusD family nutrient uptake outer membrane protein [Flavihumibacter fluminis]
MKRLYRTSLAILLAASLGACEKKVVDLDPIDQIPTDRAIRTVANVNTAVNGVYGTYQYRRNVYVNAFISDELRLGTGTEYRNVGNILFNWQHVSDSQDWRDGETGGIWTNRYAVIDRANRILELIDGIPANTPAEEALKSQYKGELLAMRAIAHFDLLNYFSATLAYDPTALGIVVQAESAKSPSSYQPARVNQQEAINLINADLVQAKTLIPATFTNASRITRNAVSAMQAKVALYTRNWGAVAGFADEVINSQPLATISAYPSLWSTKSLPENQSTEVIWKYNVNAANSGFNIGGLFQDGNGAVQASPSQKLLNTYNQEDDVRFTTFFLTAPRNLIAKYGVVTGTISDNFQYDIKILRTSELVLAKAEALAELNDLDGANDALASLRSNRIADYEHTDITDKAALIDAILEERYKELVYEGHRYLDLRRRSLPITRLLEDAGGNPQSTTLATNNTKYILPIPQQEKFANPNMQQNAGY